MEIIDQLLNDWNSSDYKGLLTVYNNKFSDQSYESIIAYKTSIDLRQIKNLKNPKFYFDNYPPTIDGLRTFLNDFNFYESKKMDKDINFYRVEGGMYNTYVESYNRFVKSDMKYIMEIGFNAGLSAINFLENTNAVVVSFDIMLHDYCWYAKMFIDNKFPGRHILISGDSIVNVKTYANLSNIKFDLIFVDGYHSVNNAYNDLINSKQLANQNSIVILDNVSPHTSWGLGPYIAMNKLIIEGEIIFIDHVELGKNYNDGFSVLKYNFDNNIISYPDLEIYKKIERYIPVYILSFYIENNKLNKNLIIDYIKKLQPYINFDDYFKQLVYSKYKIKLT